MNFRRSMKKIGKNRKNVVEVMRNSTDLTARRVWPPSDSEDSHSENEAVEQAHYFHRSVET